MSDFDDFVNDLQNRIFDEAKRAYGEKGFERWRNPLYNGRIAEPDGYARVTGKCGDTMEIYLKFENNRVKEVSYMTNGCASSSICGSFAAQLSIGKDPDELIEITGEAVIEEIGQLPEEDVHCAYLAAETLQQALSRYMSGRKTG
ncbi:MAG: iron-sulfur cluster assembly scaffold protein [Desulfobacterales bacterium]